jgi:hypothetical protein
MFDENRKQFLLDVYASCAWQDGVTPDIAAQLRASVGSTVAPATYDEVKDRLGQKAADAWQEGVDARKRFFAATADRSGRPDLPSKSDQTTNAE